jgi:ribonuclease PH
MFNPTTVSTTINGQEFSLETGKVAKQAGGSVMVRMGDTMVLVTAVGDTNMREGIDFLPLTVDYQERAYAAGRIPGNFFRREMGRPGEHETLTSRLIDRPVRPLLHKGWSFETQIIATVYSTDKMNDPDMLAMTGASAAVCISDIPFDGPFAGVRVGRVNGELIINPTATQREESDLELIVAGSRDAVTMVEGGCPVPQRGRGAGGHLVRPRKPAAFAGHPGGADGQVRQAQTGLCQACDRRGHAGQGARAVHRRGARHPEHRPQAGALRQSARPQGRGGGEAWARRPRAARARSRTWSATWKPRPCAP